MKEPRRARNNLFTVIAPFSMGHTHGSGIISYALLWQYVYGNACPFQVGPCNLPQSDDMTEHAMHLAMP